MKTPRELRLEDEVFDANVMVTMLEEERDSLVDELGKVLGFLEALAGRGLSGVEVEDIMFGDSSAVDEFRQVVIGAPQVMEFLDSTKQQRRT